MAVWNRITRRADEAERARHIAGSEATAFSTTAGAMLLGLLTGAEAARNGNEAQPPEPARPPAPSSHPAPEVTPTDPTPVDQLQALEHRHAGMIEAPAAGHAPTIAADRAETFQPPHPTALIDAPPGDQTVTAQTLISSIPVWTFNEPALHTSSPGDDAGSSATAVAPSTDPGTPVDRPADTVAGLVETTVAVVTDTVTNVGAVVGELTTSLSATVSELVGGVTGLIGNLTHDTPVAGATESLVADVLSATDATPNASDTTHNSASLLDTAGAIPMALLQPLPLQLGFLGQPTIDGHETHDGAFSALGVHHF